MVGRLERGPCLTNIFTLSTASRIGHIVIFTIITKLTCRWAVDGYPFTITQKVSRQLATS